MRVTLHAWRGRALAALLLALAAPAAATTAPKDFYCPPAGRHAALEVYSWLLEDGWNYGIAILPATDRPKTEREIKSARCRLGNSLVPTESFRGGKTAQQLFWFHRGLPGFEYPGAERRELVIHSAAVEGFVLHGPPGKDPAQIPDTPACRARDAELAKQRAALGGRLRSLRVDSDAVISTAVALHGELPRLEAGDAQVAERFEAFGQRLDEQEARIDAANEEVEAWNQAADTLLASCSHRVRARGDLPGLEAAFSTPASVYFKLVDKEESGALTRRALDGEQVVRLWATPVDRRIRDLSVAYTWRVLSSQPPMSPALKTRHLAVVERSLWGNHGQLGVVSSPGDGVGDAPVSLLYSIITAPGARVLEVAILVRDETMWGKSPMAESTLWSAILRTKIGIHEDPFPVFSRLVESAFRSFLRFPDGWVSGGATSPAHPPGSEAPKPEPR